MKRAAIVVLSLCALLICMTGCIKTPAENRPANYIAAKELSQEQKDIVDLLSTRDKIELYDFSLEDGYTTIDFRVDIYENGELIHEGIAGGTTISHNDNTLTGTAVFITSDKPGYQWTFILSMEQGGRSSHISETIPKYEYLGRGFTRIQEPIEVQDGKDIILSATLFGNNGALSIPGDLQEFQSNPDKLKDYAYAHIVKCKCTR